MIHKVSIDLGLPRLNSLHIKSKQNISLRLFSRIRLNRIYCTYVYTPDNHSSVHLGEIDIC